MKLQNIIDFMEKICPPTLAEDWDNVGLLLGSRQKKVDKILTCLTIDKAVVDEAHKLGLRVASHTESFKGVEITAAAGVDTVEHGAPLTPEMAAEMKATNSAMDVT